MSKKKHSSKGKQTGLSMQFIIGICAQIRVNIGDNQKGIVRKCCESPMETSHKHKKKKGKLIPL